jgi:hypothetical protein
VQLPTTSILRTVRGGMDWNDDYDLRGLGCTSSDF